MTGYNHYSDCTCGWCVGGGGNYSAAPPPPRPRYWTVRWTYESFTIPNAACPVCGVSVFFYQSPYGGRVFFDELGPPWPKHECTDNSSRSGSNSITRQSTPDRSTAAPLWKVNDWTPIGIDRVTREDEWFVLWCHRLDDGSFFRLLVTCRLDALVRAPALMTIMSEQGFATLSFLSTDAADQEVAVYDYGKHCLASPADAEQARLLEAGLPAETGTTAPVDGD